jgi:hypothetical protein
MSQEFDITKLRHEIADLIADKTKSANNHERAMKDLSYQNQENIKQISLRNDDIQSLNMKIDALNMTIESKD